jgi:hypothetical protein
MLHFSALHSRCRKIAQHAASLANVSRRFASTAGFDAAVRLFNFSLIHNSAGSP